MSKKTVQKWIIAVLVLLGLTLLFIFSQSLIGKEDSRAESESVMRFIKPLLEIFVGKGNVTLFLVRKLAHMTEFAVLGAELTLLALLLGKKSAGFFALAGVLAALSDETIQRFTGRGSDLADVWIDIGGAVIGTLLVLAVFLIVRLIRCRTKE